MERATVALAREGHRKRDCPDPDVELNEIQRRLAMEDKFWDDLMEGYGSRPVRRDTEYPDFKVAWRRTDLVAASKEADAAAWSTRVCDDDDDDVDDHYHDPDREARRFRDRWNGIWSGSYGQFEDITRIPAMRYTDEPPLDKLRPCNTLQIYSAKIMGLGHGFKWPLNVFGLVAIRDPVDRNRNIIFLRSRVESQTLTEKDPYLVLTGPSRAVVLSDPVTIEVDLKVKGPIESEDKTLCFLAEEMVCLVPCYSCLLSRIYHRKFCTLEFILGHILFSVEATVFVRVIDASWPDSFHGQFAACTTSFHHYGDKEPVISGSVDHKKIILCTFGAGKVPVTGDGIFELSRRVVSVQDNSMLKVSVKAWQDDNNVVEDVKSFWPKEAGRSYDTLDIGCCKMEVMVAWSLVSYFPETRSATMP